MKAVPERYSQTIFEVTTLSEYWGYALSGSGYFLITDNGRPDLIHPVDCIHCGHNGADGFRLKVVENGRKNGQYFYSESRRDLEAWSGAGICG